MLFIQTWRSANMVKRWFSSSHISSEMEIKEGHIKIEPHKCIPYPEFCSYSLNFFIYYLIQKPFYPNNSK